MRRTRRAWAIVGALLAGVVLILGLALPGALAFADDASEGTDAVDIASGDKVVVAESDADAAVQADDATGTYDIYWYALIPGQSMDSTQNPNSTWFGLGVSSISGVKAPSSYKQGTLLTSYGTISQTSTIDKQLFPPIEFGGKTYKYAAPGSGHEYDKGYYTLTPIRVVAGAGTNAGANTYNPEVASTITTFHYDNVITLNEEDILSVNFEVEDPASKTWGALEKYAQRVKSGYEKSKLKQPTVGSDGSDVPSTKVVDGVTYDFDGWYTDQACTTKAAFDGTITANTVYYGHYVPRLGSLSITKNVSGFAANAGEHFTFELTCADLAGKTFEVNAPAADDVEHSAKLTFDQDGVATLQLKHGETAAIKDLPAGVTVSVRETNLSGNAKTSTTATVNGGQPTEVKPASSTATSTNSVSASIAKDETCALSFLNTADVQPATGVSLNVAPMAALLCVAAAGVAALVAQRKRQHDARKE